MPSDIWFCIRDIFGNALDEFGGTDYAPQLFRSRAEAEEQAGAGDEFVVAAVRLMPSDHEAATGGCDAES